LGLQPAQVKNVFATETTEQNHHQIGREGVERDLAQLDTVSQMNGSSETRKEARGRKAQLLTTKSTTTIGTWNVRTLYSAGKLAQVINEIKSTTLMYWELVK
jgi:hypothetical protein